MAGEEPEPKKARFASVTEEYMDEIDRNRAPKTTRQTTEKWMKVVREYLKEKNIECDFAIIGEAECSRILRQLYVDLRQKDSTPYLKSSLLGCRAALHRHLTQSLCRPFNIYKDKVFVSANATLDGHLKNLERDGHAKPTEHKKPFSTSNFGKLMAYFDQKTTLPNPVLLTEKVWFYLPHHFCLRGREMQSHLRKDDLEIKTDENGKVYIVLFTALATKNYEGGTSGCDEIIIGRIQQTNQVAAVQLLLSKLYLSSPRLLQMAKKNVRQDEEVWFSGQPLGKNTLSLMMRRISEKVGLSIPYTNHFVKATCITKLTDSGIPDAIIMATSGHKRSESLKAYNRPTDVQMQRIAVIPDNEGDEFEELDKRPLPSQALQS